MFELSIRCECGSVTGIVHAVSPLSVNRVICHCRGCTAYARVLGRADEILDEHGGTEVVQPSPRHVRFTAGLDHVACMRLTERGALRWYASCCQTPIAHTLPSPRVPFVAINHRCVDWPGAVPKEDLVGPVRARVNARLAQDDARRLRARRRDLFAMLVHHVPLFLRWLVRGDARHGPFFDAQTRAPIREPRRVRALALGDGRSEGRGALAHHAAPRRARGCG